jgi:hypothetical protein
MFSIRLNPACEALRDASIDQGIRINRFKAPA